MSRKHLDTRTDLVAELEKIQPRTPLIEQIIAEAKAGEFHDFKNQKYVCGKMAANELLTKAGLPELAARIRNGDFDEPPDEGDKRELMDALKGSLIERNPPKGQAAPLIPRFQGRVGQASDPPEMRGKWFFTIWISILGHAEEAKEIGPIGPWDTEERAHRELQTAIRLMAEDYEKRTTGQVSGEYVDMKTNVRRKWGEQTH